MSFNQSKILNYVSDNISFEKDIKNMTPAEAEAYLNKLKANTLPKNLDVWQRNYLDILQDTYILFLSVKSVVFFVLKAWFSPSANPSNSLFIIKYLLS